MNSLYFLLELYANDFYLIFLRLYFYFFQSLIIILNSILRKTLNQNLILRLDSRLCLISLIQLTIRIKLSSIPLKMSILEKNIRRNKNRIFIYECNFRFIHKPSKGSIKESIGPKFFNRLNLFNYVLQLPEDFLVYALIASSVRV
jgi:hypothetical protein